MSRWLAVDYGHKRVGLATGCTEDGFASPVKMIPGGKETIIIEQILATAADYGCEGIVVGWPLNMDDTEGPQGKKTREFACRLASDTPLDVRLWDERLSSYHADQMLAGTLTRKKRKARQDAIAAANILQDFLDKEGPDKALPPSDTIEP